MFLGLIVHRFDDRVGQFNLDYVQAGLANDDLGTLAMGPGKAAREVAVDHADVVDQTDFLEGCENPVDANNVDFASGADDFFVNGVGAQSGVGIGKRTDDLDARHGDSVAGRSQLSQCVLFVCLRFVHRCYSCHIMGILRTSLFHVSIVYDVRILAPNTL